MTLTHETIGDVVVIEPLLSRLDAESGEDFRADVESHLQPDAKIVLDLHCVDFVDSAGLGTLLSLLKKLVATGGDLKLCELTPRARSVFERARMPQILEIHPTRVEAVGSYA